MRPRLTTAIPALPALIGAAWVASFFAPLLSPALALANRDVPLFHLPLRTAFARLAVDGLPQWNPWLHGGQPVLSNPSYAAFYPPSWLVLAVPPHYALSLLAVLHAGLAFAGAFRLARRLGCGRPAAALAAVGFAGGCWYLSLLSAFTLFCGMAWLPWVLAWGDEALAAPPGAGRSWLRPAVLSGLALGLQLLNGEPTTALMGGLALLAFAVPAARRPAVLPRVLLPFAVAVALAAVQLAPTWQRLADSPRRGGLGAAAAHTWSLPPARLVEIVFPRFFGDPARAQEGLFFGWRLNDQQFPYVVSLYPGLLLAVLGVAALARWRVPRRAALLLAIAAGLFLAAGRYNPLFEPVRAALPLLAQVRYPEKFAVLALAALGVAGALGWQRLLDEREAGRREHADFPLALSLVVLAAAVALAAFVHLRPWAVSWLVAQGAPGLPAASHGRVLGWLRGESLAAVGAAAAVAALFALCRWRRPPRRLLEALALLLLAADLRLYGHGLVETLPAREYRRPPPVVAKLSPGERVHVVERDRGGLEPVALELAPGLARTRAVLGRLAPYSGVLWGVSYALHDDYDLMLTSWGRHALRTLRRDTAGGHRPYLFLGAWNVGTLAFQRSPQRLAAELAGGGPVEHARLARNPYVLPRFRFVPAVAYHPTRRAAVDAAVARGWHLTVREHCVSEVAAGERAFPARPQLLGVDERGGRAAVRYRAASPAFLVIAATYDRGWRGTVAGGAVPLCGTAAGQIGVELPAGEHELRLEYRTRGLLPGAAVSFLAIAACSIMLWRSRRTP